MNGDGNKDLVVGNKLEANYLYLNNGSATPFKNVVPRPVSTDRFATFAMDTGDVDSDGDIDLITGNEYNRIRLYLNNGTSDPFNGVTGIDLSDRDEFTVALKVIDINNDSHLDVIAGNAGEENRLYLNNGTANPFENVQAQQISPARHLTFAIDAADIDNDGDIDVIAGNSFAINYIYLNNGTTKPFENVIPIAVTNDVSDTYGLAVGDIDNNGFVDLVFANFGHNRVYLNNGTLSSWTESNLSDDISDTVTIALHDINNDGSLDCLCGNEGINRLYVNNGTATPFSSVEHFDITDDAHITNTLIFEDMDNDGDSDIIAGNENQINRLYINNGFVAGGESFYADSDRSKALAYGDFNNDGHQDLVVANNGINRIYYNDGTSTPFQGNAGYPVTTDDDPCYGVAVGDVDGDNDQDIIFANYSGINKIYPNNGTASPFSGIAAINIGVEMDDTLSIILVDIDLDGDLDLLTANDGINRLYLNNGTSNPFYGVMGLPVSNDDSITTSIAVGDVDNDGDLDIVAGNEGFFAAENRLYLNNGTDNPFLNSEGSNISKDLDNTKAVLLADVDDDHDLDVITGNAGQVNRIYLNNGTSDPFAGVTAIDIHTEKNNTKHIVLADIDHDGDDDLLCANYNSKNRIYKKVSQTAPFFDYGAPMGITDHQTIAMIAFDADNDGDIDVVEANDNHPNVYFANNGNAQSLLVLSQPAPNPGFYLIDGTIVSLEIDAIESGNIPEAILNVSMETPPNTHVDFYLSNTGGNQFFQVQPGSNFVFPTSGTDLRWKAQSHTLCPTLSPSIKEIQITRDCVLISDIPNHRMPKNSVIEIPLTLTHYVGTPELSAESSNPNLLPDSQIVISCTEANCIVRVEPYPDMTGTSYIVVSVNDGCKTVTDNFRLDVYNQAPVCVPDYIELSCTHNEPVDIFINATDPENDMISYEPSSMPQHGHVGGTAPNIRYIVQDSNFVGIDCFSYKISDGMDDTLVRICIKINDPIACKPGKLVVYEDQYMESTLACNKELPRIFYFLTSPEQGDVTIINQSEGDYLYKPDQDVFGNDRFTFYVSKGTDNSAPCPVTVTILPVNDAPGFTKGNDIDCKSHENKIVNISNWATNISPGPLNEQDQKISFSVSVSDTSYFLRLPQISPDGMLTFQPAVNVSGAVDVSVSLADNGGIQNGGINKSVTQKFQINFEKVFTKLRLLPVWQASVTLDGMEYPETSLNDTFFPSSVFPFWEKRFDINSFVNLKVNPTKKWKFIQFTGSGLPLDITPTNSEISLQMNEDREISAEFVPLYELSILGDGNGTIKINGQPYTLNYQALFVENQNIQIQAIPGTDHTFGGFTGDINHQQSEITLTIRRDMTITANFLEMYPLHIDGYGRVAVNGVDADLPFMKKMPQNEDIVICGLPESQFKQWTGDIISTDNPKTFQMQSAMNVTLNLKPLIISLKSGWNLVSIPLQTDEVYALTEVFPQASIAYKYQGDYVETMTITSQEAYWIKNSISQDVNIHGVYLNEYTKSLSPGWHIIPSIAKESEIKLLTDNSSFLLYGFKDGAYYPTSILKPGYGYWIMVNQASDLNILPKN
ncbi:MAG: hypothetical protein OMM_01464 [Candidatus Magnetoglobus multicellularis str. Araruama]|uniref:Bacterial repeat domain-containing protein n=1 Tax=Candidatus Magnetoglobus multicellularis str. Araruama TaxID=890399 RepID=A0A1V1PCX1_9BACT|nr:MAG: hypothetical protein OMM_01464 [Candidatus Magnetoglobus multicellularis str. Araruama]